MQRASDALCKEYGLSVIRNPKGRGKTYSEWAAEKDGKPTLRSIIRSDIDRAILASTTQRNFQEAMQAMGYTFKTRTPDGQPLKYPALRPPGAKGYFRFHRLGPGYSLTEILDRVYDNVRRQTPFPEEDRMARMPNISLSLLCGGLPASECGTSRQITEENLPLGFELITDETQR